MGRDAKPPLCYILCTRDLRHYWRGPGCTLLEDGICLQEIPTWADKMQARAAAVGIKTALGIDLVPTAVRLPG